MIQVSTVGYPRERRAVPVRGCSCVVEPWETHASAEPFPYVVALGCCGTMGDPHDRRAVPVSGCSWVLWNRGIPTRAQSRSRTWLLLVLWNHGRPTRAQSRSRTWLLLGVVEPWETHTTAEPFPLVVALGCCGTVGYPRERRAVPVRGCSWCCGTMGDPRERRAVPYVVALGCCGTMGDPHDRRAVPVRGCSWVLWNHGDPRERRAVPVRGCSWVLWNHGDPRERRAVPVRGCSWVLWNGRPTWAQSRSRTWLLLVLWNSSWCRSFSILSTTPLRFHTSNSVFPCW